MRGCDVCAPSKRDASVTSVEWYFVTLRALHGRISLFSFSILITLLGEEGAGLCAHRAFVC